MKEINVHKQREEVFRVIRTDEVSVENHPGNKNTGNKNT
jgi:hypothetical protein